MTGFLVELDPHTSAPPFVQLYEQIATLAASGGLTPGSRLPAVRQLANDLGVASGTVARAYRELERDGIVETRGRHGTRIRADGVPQRLDGDAELRAAARTFAVRATHLGFDSSSALAAAAEALAAMRSNAGDVPVARE
jgi:DNA-binding transcriptional regulator YhcF (GntR family)